MTHFLLKAVTPASPSCQERGCELHRTIASVAVMDLVKVMTKLGISQYHNTNTHLQLLCYGLVWSVPNVGQNRVHLNCLTASLKLFSCSISFTCRKFTCVNVFQCDTNFLPRFFVTCYLSLVFVMKAFKSIKFTVHS